MLAQPSKMFSYTLNARVWLIVTGIVEAALVLFGDAWLTIFLLYSAVKFFPKFPHCVSLYLPGTVLNSLYLSSAALFLCHGDWVGVVIKKDLSGIGRALIAALFGLQY